MTVKKVYIFNYIFCVFIVLTVLEWSSFHLETFSLSHPTTNWNCSNKYLPFFIVTAPHSLIEKKVV